MSRKPKLVSSSNVIHIFILIRSSKEVVFVTLTFDLVGKVNFFLSNKNTVSDENSKLFILIHIYTLVLQLKLNHIMFDDLDL